MGTSYKSFINGDNSWEEERKKNREETFKRQAQEETQRQNYNAKIRRAEELKPYSSPSPSNTIKTSQPLSVGNIFKQANNTLSKINDYNNNQMPQSNMNNNNYSDTPSYNISNKFAQGALSNYKNPQAIKNEPSWGSVIKNSVKSGLTGSLGGAVNMVRTGAKFADNYMDNKDGTFINFLNNTYKYLDDKTQSYDKNLQNISPYSNKDFLSQGIKGAVQVGTTLLPGAAVSKGAKAVGLGAKAVNAARMLPFGVQAGGNYASEAEKAGATEGQQLAYGLIGAGAEIASESFFGLGPLVNKFGKTGAKEIINNGANTLISKYGKLGLSYAKDILGETAQEVAINPVMGLAEKGIYNKDKALVGENGVIDTAQMGQDAFGGAAMSVILSAIGLGSNTLSHRKASYLIENNIKPTPEVIKDIQDTMDKEMSTQETTQTNKIPTEGIQNPNSVNPSLNMQNNSQNDNLNINTQNINAPSVATVKPIVNDENTQNGTLNNYQAKAKANSMAQNQPTTSGIEQGNINTPVTNNVAENQLNTNIESTQLKTEPQVNNIAPKPSLEPPVLNENNQGNVIAPIENKQPVNAPKAETKVNANLEAPKTIEPGQKYKTNFGEVTVKENDGAMLKLVNKSGTEIPIGVKAFNNIKPKFLGSEAVVSKMETTTNEDTIIDDNTPTENLDADNPIEMYSNENKAGLNAEIKPQEEENQVSGVINPTKEKTSLKSNSEDIKNSVNDEVMLNHNGKIDAGKISKVNNDGTYEVQRPEGDYVLAKKNGEDFEVVKSEPTTKEQLPMDERDNSNVGNKKVKAYQYLHPELKHHIQSEANILQGELREAIPASAYMKSTYEGESSGVVDKYTRTQRVASQDIAYLKDTLKASYEDIGKALDNIIKDNGSENNALSKKIELLIDHRLSNGYTDMMGNDMPSNNEYVTRKNEIEGVTNKKETNKSETKVKENNSQGNKSNNPKEDMKNKKQTETSKLPFKEGDICKSDGGRIFKILEIKEKTMIVKSVDEYEETHTFDIESNKDWKVLSQEEQIKEHENTIRIFQKQIQKRPHIDPKDWLDTISWHENKIKEIKGSEQKDNHIADTSKMIEEKPKKEAKKDISYKNIDNLNHEELLQLEKELKEKVNDEYWTFTRTKSSKVSPNAMAELEAQLRAVQKKLGKKKEFYEMTKEEAKAKLRMPENKHREYVEKALQEGKEIPENVLKDYSDLTETKKDITSMSNEETSKKITLNNWLDTISKDDINYDKAYNAYRAISFEPDRRAESEQKGYVDAMNDIYEKMSKLAETPEQKVILLSELNKYKENYLKHMNEILSAKSRTMSAMITGPARFPKAKNEKALQAEHNKVVAFLEWQKKAEKSIKNKLQGALTEEQKTDAEYERLKKESDNVISVLKGIETGTEKGYNPSLFRNSLRDKLMRSLNNGNVETVSKILDYIKETEKQHLKKPVFAANNGIWESVKLAKEKLNNQAEIAPGEETIKEYDGATIIKNHNADRVQIFFDEKPNEEIRKELKSTGWHYSKANGDAWQRKLTSNAEYAAKRIMDKYFKEVEKDIGKNDTIPDQFKGEGEKIGIVAPAFRNGMSKEGKHTFKNEETNKRYEASKGIKRIPKLKKAMDWLTNFKNMSTRTYRHIDEKDSNNAEFIKEMTQYSKYHGIVADETVKTLKDIVSGLDANSYDTFNKYVLLKDLQEEAEKGNLLPFGLTKETVNEELEALKPYMADYVVEAVNKRDNYWKKLKNDYILSMADVGFNVADKFKRENYFRHQVLDKMKENQLVNGTSGKAKVSRGRGFLKQRQGSELDINSDYLQAEYEVMAQMLRDTEVAKMQKRIIDRYDLSKDLKEEAEKITEENTKDLVKTLKELRQELNSIDKEDTQAIENLEGKINDLKEEIKSKTVDWHTLIPEGYSAMQLIDGNTYYTATTLPQRLVNGIIDNIPENIGVNANDLKTALAVGQKHPEYVFDNNMIETLQATTKVNDRNPLAAFGKKGLNLWKRWVLGVNPHTFLKYNIRNMTGDFDKVTAADPKIIKHANRAKSELYAAMKYGRFTPDMLEYYKHGGFSSLTIPQEIGELSGIDKFQKFYNQKKGIKINNPFVKWIEFTEFWNDLREGVLRYSAFLQAKEDLKKGKPVYWASKPSLIDGLSNTNDKAYKLANDLLGAYDEVTETGKVIRDYWIPFYSWLEVNFKGYTQLIKNNSNMSIIEKQLKYKGKDVNTANKAGQLLLNNASFGIKATLLATMLYTWNNFVVPDDEDELPDDVKSTVHITLGRDKNGNIWYFNRLGSLSDFIEWFGLSGIGADIRDLKLDRKTGMEQFKDMLKRPANKVYSGLNPFIKSGLIELPTGKKMYPDVFSPSAIRDKRTYVGQALGLSYETSKILGIPTETDSKDNALGFVGYKSDPEANAYYAILDKKRQFEEKVLGQYPSEAYNSSPKTLALYYYKLALKKGDMKLANKYLGDYYKNGGTEKGIAQSINMMSPLYGLVEDEKDNRHELEQFKEFLTSDEKRQLDKAMKYYQDLAGKSLVKDVGGVKNDIIDNIKYNTGDSAKRIRKQAQQIYESNLSNEEKNEKLEKLLKESENVGKGTPTKKKKEEINPYNK